MKISDISEAGFAGNVGTALKGLASPGGATAAARAQSKDPKVAARGKIALAKAGAKRAGSKRGQKAKKRKMATVMYNKWADKANQIRIETGGEPSVRDLAEWIGEFMGDRNIGDVAMPKALSDRDVKKYFSNLVNTFYQQAPKKADDTDTATQATAAKKSTQPTPSGKHKRNKQSSMRNKPMESKIRKRYLTMLREADTRIQHAEDIIFWEGSAGAKRSIQALLSMSDKQHKDVTLKWDGSPAIVFGRDESGQFIFTDKSGFLKKGGVGKTTSPAALKKELLGRSGGIHKDKPDRIAFADNMARLFKIYKKAVPANYRGFFKGDLLYSTTPEIKDKHFTFKPNIVTYTVGVETELGEQIANSTSGVVIHREVDADGNESSFNNVDVFEGNDVFVVPTITTVAPVKPNTELLDSANSIISKNATKLDAMLHEPTLREKKITDLPKIFYTYINSKVDTGLENLGGDFSKWIATSKLSDKKKENVLDYIQEHKTQFVAMWNVVTAIKKAKNDIIEQFDAQGINVKQSIGDQPGGEGYVLAHPKGDIKLVPRASFSAANRALKR